MTKTQKAPKKTEMIAAKAEINTSVNLTSLQAKLKKSEAAFEN